MKMNWKWSPVATACLAMSACGGEQSTEGLVARVDDYRLTVDDAVDLLADEERLAAESGVVESLANLWIDYTLLAEATAVDSTYPKLDFEPLVMQQLNQVMVMELRDSVIQVDTFVTDSELRAKYEADTPSVRVHAHHIMLRAPIAATEQQKDSVRSVLEGLRSRIQRGESFENLARRYSQDGGTAANGGDLGFFGRGEMVAPFEEAVFALQPGQMSDVVETPMGLHLIRLDERRVQSFEEVAPGYRRQVQAQMVQDAESVYVAGLFNDASPSVTEGAAEVARELAANPGSRLSGRAERRALVEWNGGAVRVSDLRTTLQVESPNLRQQMTDGTDEDINQFLEGLARRTLLVKAAEASGLRPVQDSVESLEEDARSQLRRAARTLGLTDLDRAPGEALEIAVARAVKGALSDNLTGATRVVPLGLIGFQLRRGRSASVFDQGVGQVILEVARIRAARSLSPTEQTPSAGAVPDTAGR